MDIWLNLGWVLLGLICLFYGADWLVKGSVAIALAIGIPALIVALTIVAFGTSAPELVVSLNANLEGKGDFALGNIIGSNICNIALVLGIVALLRPIDIHSQLVKREIPLLLAATIVFVLMLIDGKLGQIEGAILVVGVLAYTFFSIYTSKADPVAADAALSELPASVTEDSDLPAADHAAETKTLQLESAPKKGNLPKIILINTGLLLVGFAFLVLGANRLVLGGENLARMFGIPEAIIALTLVAFGTSLPEIATSVVATLKKQGDIVTGNAIGSCIFNLLAVAGITACVSPILAVDINHYDFYILLAFTGLAYFLVRKDLLVSRLEGALLLGCYIIYVVWLSMR